ncbi:hypothetical protein RRF57_002469 [Xylaria bambusicola]|uniref:Uncharacterized protein n=1 Tax=Xylaria bambusicola TaxID=326684 RepID=A0AAN7UD65_9PEZI
MADMISIVIAVISLVGSIASASITGWVAYHNDKAKRLSESNALVAKYGDPLLLAAMDLQSRLHNHLENNLAAYMRFGRSAGPTMASNEEARGQNEGHSLPTQNRHSATPRYRCRCGDTAVRSGDHIHHIQMYHTPAASQLQEVTEDRGYYTCCCNRKTADPTEHINHIKQCKKVLLSSKVCDGPQECKDEGIEEYTSLDNMRKDLVVFYTLFTIDQYFSWTYILRRQIQFLRFSTERHNKKLSDILWAIEGVFRTDRYGGPDGDRFMIWRGQQMAIGEIMTITEGDDEKELYCMGYSEFYSKFQRSDGKMFKMWFDPVIADIKWLTELGPSSHMVVPRLIHLRHLLMDLMDFLDPEGSIKRRKNFRLLSKPRDNYGCKCSLCGLKE